MNYAEFKITILKIAPGRPFFPNLAKCGITVSWGYFCV
jgi:hypothetical protein